MCVDCSPLCSARPACPSSAWLEPLHAPPSLYCALGCKKRAAAPRGPPGGALWRAVMRNLPWIALTKKTRDTQISCFCVLSSQSWLVVWPPFDVHAQRQHTPFLPSLTLFYPTQVTPPTTTHTRTHSLHSHAHTYTHTLPAPVSETGARQHPYMRSLQAARSVHVCWRAPPARLADGHTHTQKRLLCFFARPLRLLDTRMTKHPGPPFFDVRAPRPRVRPGL